jgi:hypothetical protein
MCFPAGLFGKLAASLLVRAKEIRRSSSSSALELVLHRAILSFDNLTSLIIEIEVNGKWQIENENVSRGSAAAPDPEASG